MQMNFNLFQPDATIEGSRDSIQKQSLIELPVINNYFFLLILSPPSHAERPSDVVLHFPHQLIHQVKIHRFTRHEMFHRKALT